MQADAKAFATLMQYLEETDRDKSIVLTVQVENEPGILGDSRDASRPANLRFSSPVPEELQTLLLHAARCIL
jgi:hypothetical protein